MRSGTFKERTPQLIALQQHWDGWAWYALLAAAFAVLPSVASGYVLSYATLILIAVVGALGLNLLTGTTGLISLGQAGFLAIGGYTAAILLTDHQWPLVPSLLAAGMLSSIVSLLVGIPSLRLKGLYLAITTLAFSIIITQVIQMAEPLTHGSNGIQVQRPTFLGMSMRSGVVIYYLCLAVTALTLLGVLNLLRTRAGRAWAAIRDYDTAAEMMGVNLTRYKLLAFATSSFVVGIAGALLGLHMRFLNTDNFGILTSIEALAMIVVGGLGRVRGAVLGAVFIVLLPELSRLAFSILTALLSSTLPSNFASSNQDFKGVLYGLAIILFLRFEPDGLARRWMEIKQYWSQWPLAKRRSKR